MKDISGVDHNLEIERARDHQRTHSSAGAMRDLAGQLKALAKATVKRNYYFGSSASLKDGQNQT